MSKTSKRRWVLWTVVSVAVIVMLALAMAPKATPVDLQSVTRGPLTVTLDHEGKTRAKDIFVISAPLPGRVLRVEHEPGDPVLAGETVLATFVPATPVLLDARTRAEAAARMQAAAATLERSRAERARSRAEADFAAADLKRYTSLAAQGVVSVTELDIATRNSESLVEALAAADAAVNAAVHELEAANAVLLDPVEETDSVASVLELRSPVDGVVLRRIRESAAVVAQGEPLLEVADSTEIEVIADFLSKDAVQIRPGMQVILERWGGEEDLNGRVRLVEPAGFMKISALGVEEQRVWVVVELVDDSEVWQGLGDDFRVEVRVVVWTAEDALRVPTAALFRDGESWAVFVDDDGRARLRPVETGHRNGLQAEVLVGLSESDVVIIHPPDSIGDGSRIARR